MFYNKLIHTQIYSKYKCNLSRFQDDIQKMEKEIASYKSICECYKMFLMNNGKTVPTEFC